MKLYYIDVKVFDTFEETSSLIRRAVIATDEDGARDIVAKQMEEEKSLAVEDFAQKIKERVEWLGWERVILLKVSV